MYDNLIIFDSETEALDSRFFELKISLFNDSKFKQLLTRRVYIECVLVLRTEEDTKKKISALRRILETIKEYSAGENNYWIEILIQGLEISRFEIIETFLNHLVSSCIFQSKIKDDVCIEDLVILKEECSRTLRNYLTAVIYHNFTRQILPES